MRGEQVGRGRGGAGGVRRAVDAQDGGAEGGEEERGEGAWRSVRGGAAVGAEVGRTGREAGELDDAEAGQRRGGSCFRHCEGRFTSSFRRPCSKHSILFANTCSD